MLAAALEAEVDTYLAGLARSRTSAGIRVGVRYGHTGPPVITTGRGHNQLQATCATSSRKAVHARASARGRRGARQWRAGERWRVQRQGVAVMRMIVEARAVSRTRQNCASERATTLFTLWW